MKIFWFDLETTNADPETARIVQFAYMVIDMDNGEIIAEDNQIVNPGKPIDAEAVEVHGITDSQAQQKPSFSFFAGDIRKELNKCGGIGGYNSHQFDNVILERELERADCQVDLSEKIDLDVFALINKLYPRTLVGMVKLFTGVDFEGDAHDAMADIIQTVELAKEVIGQSGVELSEINEILYANELDRGGNLKFNDDGTAEFTFGKLKGMSLEEAVQMEWGYLTWILKNDFPEDFKQIIRAARTGKFPSPT